MTVNQEQKAAAMDLYRLADQLDHDAEQAERDALNQFHKAAKAKQAEIRLGHVQLGSKLRQSAEEIRGFALEVRRTAADTYGINRAQYNFEAANGTA